MRRRLPVLCLLLSLRLSSGPTARVAADEAADLRAHIEKFFVLYARKDLDGFMALWSEKAPDYAARKPAMAQLFGGNDIAFADLAMSRMTIDPGKGSLRVTVTMTSVNAKTAHSSRQRMSRNFELIREANGWKVFPSAAPSTSRTDPADTIRLRPSGRP